MDMAIDCVRKALEGFDEVNTSANTITASAAKIVSSLSDSRA
jgi:hypothetical protein